MSVYAWLGKNRNFGAAGQFSVSALIASWVNLQAASQTARVHVSHFGLSNYGTVRVDRYAHTD